MPVVERGNNGQSLINAVTGQVPRNTENVLCVSIMGNALMVARIYLYCAAAGYILALLYYCGPEGVRGSSLLHPFCIDVCLFIDPTSGASLLSTALFIAPMNALICGIGGAIVGLCLHVPD
jgi:hypothetical protein